MLSTGGTDLDLVPAVAGRGGGGRGRNWLTRARSKQLWRSLSQLFHQGITAADNRLRTVAIRPPEAPAPSRS